MNWRFLDTGHNNAVYNMAVDEALMRLSDTPAVRFYGWKPAAVSIGYFQDAEKAVNIEICNKNRIDVVRRITGGNAVLHDKELTYSLVAYKELLPGSIIESYKMISAGAIKALHSLGINAAMNEFVDKQEKSAICFIEPSYYEITANNKKIVGSAQKRKNNKVLQHGSILIDIDFEKLFSVFDVNNDIEKERIRNRMTSINDETNNKLSYGAIAQALKKGFEENFGVCLKKGSLTSKEIELTNRLIKDKYNRNKNAK